MKTNTTPFSIKGGEVFIDFIANESDKASGTLYYLTDKYWSEKWKQISTTATLKKACDKRNSESQIVKVEYSLDPDNTRNNPAIRASRNKLVLPRQFEIIKSDAF